MGRLKKHPEIKLGDIFCRLTVLEKADVRNGNRYWKCQCECGEIRTICSSSLKHGNSKSCGCLAREITSLVRGYKEPGKTSYKAKYFASRASAERDGLEFSISFDEFVSIVIRNCFYCGREGTEFNVYAKKDGSLVKRRDSVTKSTFDKNWVIVNGIDRVDNSIGYALLNCEPCCWRCNNIKSDYSKEDFLGHVKAIALNCKLLSNGTLL